jgi:hypothetical protein
MEVIMKICNQEYSNGDMYRYCNPSSIYNARRYTLSDGRGAGQKLIEVKTAAGLRLTLSESRCLDIVELEYRNVNFGFLSKNGIGSIPVDSPETDSFLKYWSGGFLATCGLRNAGDPSEHNGEFFPLHGHIGLTPAENVNISVDEREIKIRGTMRETALYGHNLELVRTITVPSDGADVTVHDAIHNRTPEAEPIFLLYHVNFGFPFLSEHLKLTFPEGTVKGRTPDAEAVIADHAKITAPIDGQSPYVFFHYPKDKTATVVLENTRLNVAAGLTYDTKSLPVLAQWKCMKSGDYALGIEPGTSHIKGRKAELESGYGVKVEPFGTLEYGFRLSLRA